MHIGAHMTHRIHSRSACSAFLGGIKANSQISPHYQPQRHGAEFASEKKKIAVSRHGSAGQGSVEGVEAVTEVRAARLGGRTEAQPAKERTSFGETALGVVDSRKAKGDPSSIDLAR